MRLVRIGVDAQAAAKWSTQPGLIVELALLRMAKLSRTVEIEDVLKALRGAGSLEDAGGGPDAAGGGSSRPKGGTGRTTGTTSGGGGPRASRKRPRLRSEPRARRRALVGLERR